MILCCPRLVLKTNLGMLKCSQGWEPSDSPNHKIWELPTLKPLTLGKSLENSSKLLGIKLGMRLWLSVWNYAHGHVCVPPENANILEREVSHLNISSLSFLVWKGL
jgi:hypothetical protein